MSTASTLRPVLFDIDGTLIDSNPLHVLAWSRAFREHGYEIADEAIHAQIGKGGDNLLPTLLPQANSDEQAAIDARQGEIFAADYLAEAKPFRNAAELLRHAAAAGKQIVLASSATQSEVDHYAGLLGIADILAATTSIDDVNCSKPEPDIFAVALRKIGLEPTGALVVGDTIWDVEAASRIGLGTIALLSGGVSAHDLEQAGAIAIYEDAARLLAFYAQSPLAR
ncbi:membrane protein [Sphingomonas vulcanisoli]|uniref:Membrane protein n=1 Tax=Sphingomonas vulcanisoli TaxID=1658060 RepID=A0ABX0TS20_9SPHN|nr:membrane protein [Sphingomonas vulcanisoli]